MNSPTTSKINWTQIAGVVAAFAMYYGVEIEPEALAAALVGTQSIVALITIIWRTWYTAAK
jgi:hypothetical protein